MSSPPPIFTDTPRQHPNLIIGALHLLVWMVFHPTAFRNHLTTLDPELKVNSLSLFFLSKGRWRRSKNIRFFLQSQIILPILGAVIVGCGNLLMGVPLGRVVGDVAFGVAGGVVGGVTFGVVGGVAYGLVFGVAFSLVFSLVFGVAFSLVFGMAGGVALGLDGGIALGVVGGMAGGVALGVVFGVAFSLVFGVAGGVALGLDGGMALGVALGLNGVALGVAYGMALGVAYGVGLTIHNWLPYLIYPSIHAWNNLLYRLDKFPHKRQRMFLRWHSVGWYEWEHLPFTRFDRHLLLATEINPTLGIEAIDYVSTTKQKWAAQSAQIELQARNLARCQRLNAITQLSTDWGQTSLSSPATDIFRIFNRVIRDTKAACEQQSNYNQQLALTNVVRNIESELVGFNHSTNKYTVRFRPILAQWREIIADHIEAQRQATELNQEIESPYIIGIPLPTKQKLFTGRQDLGSRLEQLILDARRPPLLLYGQRRMGKTSLLNNLNRLLPSTIIPLFVDLQGNAASASNLAGFLYALAKDLRTAAIQREIALLPVQLADFQAEPIIQFNDWLDTLETALGDNIALLALDEFEALDTAFQRERLDPEDVLGLLRRLIQHRSKFKVLIAGSHSLAEYQRWSSYLINVQTLHISYLKEAEAKQLIERPIPDFPLQYTEDALKLVLHLTHCHPYLVQLLCAEIIALKNEQDPSQRKLT